MWIIVLQFIENIASSSVQKHVWVNNSSIIGKWIYNIEIDRQTCGDEDVVIRLELV